MDHVHSCCDTNNTAMIIMGLTGDTGNISPLSKSLTVR